MRLTRRVFADLVIYMLAFGLAIGLVFPFFMLLLGVSRDVALTPSFFGACIGAGIISGFTNFALARKVVSGRLRILSDVGERMRALAASVRVVDPDAAEIETNGPTLDCSEQSCLVEIDSDDEFGRSAEAFNQLVRTLGHSLQTEAAVRGFSDLLASQLALEELTSGALDRLLQDTKAEAGALLVEHDGRFAVAASRGLRDPDLLTENERVKMVSHKGLAELIRTPEGVRVDGVLSDFEPHEVIVVPIAYKHASLGSLILATSTQFDDEAKIRLSLVRQPLALALNNSLAHERLQVIAALDPLTGMSNRRHGLQRMREEFARVVRSQTPLGVLMVDIDHFKAVNDTYGHQVGDRVLKRVAEGVKSALREGDVLVRYGGEEFLAILPAASCEDLRIVGERIRRVTADTEMSHGEQRIAVTVSVGGSSFPEAVVDTEQALVGMADAALYEAKEQGRDRVIIVT